LSRKKTPPAAELKKSWEEQNKKEWPHFEEEKKRIRVC
jgi:hypothetical protein